MKKYLQLCWVILVAGLILITPGVGAGEAKYLRERHEMINAIEDDVLRTSQYIGRQDLDTKVMDALRMVPRHEFVPRSMVPHAYENRPLPIGHGQTISQPYIVALMSDLIGIRLGDRVLEVGTGSGYQAAILDAMGAEVYTIEIIKPLAEEAVERLKRLGYYRIHTKTGDGYYGWPDAAPFDAIVVTAAASHVPPPLIKQLKPGGRMVIPVGSQFMVQQLLLVEKSEQGEVRSRQILPVRFVPLTGAH